MYPLLIKTAGRRGSLLLNKWPLPSNKDMYGLGTFIGDPRIRTEPKFPICQSSLSPERTGDGDMKIWSLTRQSSFSPCRRTDNETVRLWIGQNNLYPDKRPNTAQTWTQQNTTNLMNSNIENHLPLIPTPEPGKYFDVVSCLSSSGGDVLIRNNGDKVSLSADHFRGKYVLVCCFHVPLVETELFQALIDRCSELYSTRDDFELVMVAGMSSQLVDDPKAVFNQFFSRFPESCLAVPFEYFKQRDSICKLLDLDCTQPDRFQRLLLDKEGIVLPPLNLLSVFLHYEVEEWQCQMKKTYKTTLETLLRGRGSTSPLGAVYKLNPAGGPREEVAISDLNFDDKSVGVYLCCDASFLDVLVKIYKECKEKKLDFKIVVVFMLNRSVGYPAVYQKYMESLLLEHDECLDWWCFPYDPSVKEKLLEFTDNKWIDDVIVIGPLVNQFARTATYVMAKFGIDAYPFSLKAAVKAFVKQLSNLRMESFLGSSQLFRGNDRDDVISVESLRGKKIILQVDSVYIIDKKHMIYVEEKLDILVPFYHKMKEAFPDFEMVFIQHDCEGFDEDSEINRAIQGEIPWYVCRYNETNFTWVCNLLYMMNLPDHGLFGFGEDGRLRTILDLGTITKYEEDLIRDFQPSDDTISDYGKRGVYHYLQ